MSKVIARVNKNQGETSHKCQGLVYAPLGKEKQWKTKELEEESFSERYKEEYRGGLKSTESEHRGFVPEKNFSDCLQSSPEEKLITSPKRKISESWEKL